MEQLHAKISGDVQGVGFRWFTLQAARECQVDGWVRNLPDGRVELLAQGERARLSRLLQHVRQGPPGSRVLQVIENWGPVDERESGFRIL